MHIELRETVPGVSPERALDWWMDFRDGQEDHAFIPGSRRKVVERTADSVLLVEDVKPLGLPLFRERVSVERAGRAARFRGTNTYADFEGEYAFEPAPEGTVATLRADLKLKRPWMAPRRVVEEVLRRDLRGHLAQMGKEPARDAAPPPGPARSP